MSSLVHRIVSHTECFGLPLLGNTHLICRTVHHEKSGCENRIRVSASTRLKDDHYPNPDTYLSIPSMLKYVTTACPRYAYYPTLLYLLLWRYPIPFGCEIMPDSSRSSRPGYPIERSLGQPSISSIPARASHQLMRQRATSCFPLRKIS